MLIGVPREIKKQENRVGLTPGSVRELVHHGRITYPAVAAALGLDCTHPEEAILP